MRLCGVLLFSLGLRASGLIVGSTGAALSRSRIMDGQSPAASSSKPHIIFILCDDMGMSGVGRYNAEVKTPYIDELFTTGIIHEAHYSASVCAPARAAFLSGRLPFRLRASVENFPLNALEGTELGYTLLPSALKSVGYVTHMIGKWHQGYYNSSYTPTMRGFDSFYGFLTGAVDHFDSSFSPEVCNAKVSKIYDLHDDGQLSMPGPDFHSGTAYSLRAVKIISSHDQSKPLFLYLALHDPHGPIEAPKEYIARYSFNHHAKNVYYGMLSVIDDTVGNLTRALRDKGMYDRSLIIFTSDNGVPVSDIRRDEMGGVTNYPLRGGKSTVWEGGIKVPTTISGGFVPQSARGRNVRNLMSIADWYATFAYVAGFHFDGRENGGSDSLNQWPYLVGLEVAGPREHLVYRVEPFLAKNRYDDFQGAGRIGKWKLIVGPQHYAIREYSETNEPLYDVVQCDMSPCLFNIHEDPFEENDLSKSNPEKLKEMLHWWREVGKIYQDQDLSKASQIDYPSMCSHFAEQQFITPWDSSSPKLVVWINSFGRSSSSTVLSMIRAANDDWEADADELFKEHLGPSLDGFSDVAEEFDFENSGSQEHLGPSLDGFSDVVEGFDFSENSALVRDDVENTSVGDVIYSVGEEPAYSQEMRKSLQNAVAGPVGHIKDRDQGPLKNGDRSRMVFSLFEPCHNGDVPQVKDYDGCHERLLQISQCDFASISKLHGWKNTHSSTHAAKYSPELAKVMCSSADIITFKTINTIYAGPPKLQRHIRLLDKEPRLRIIDVVRDPRGILASYKEQDWGDITIEEICNCMASNLEVSHDRVHRVVFEDMIADPYKVTENVYKSLGLLYDGAQKRWVDANFDATSCGAGDRYSDCHTDSKGVGEKWKTILSEEEKQRFADHWNCQLVSQAYGYPS